MYSPMVNNNDYFRVAHSMGIVVPTGIRSGDYYLFTTPAVLPRTSFALLGYGFYWLQIIFGSHGFHTALLEYALSAIFFSGLFLLVLNQKKIGTSVLIILVLSLEYLVFGFYFKSLYEEVMVLALLPWLLYGIEKIRDKKCYGVFVTAGFFIILAKVQMAFICPVLIAIIYDSDKKFLSDKNKRIMAELLLLAVMIDYHSSGAALDVNRYDRYYNGIGWSLQNVAAWPAQTIGERARYFYGHQRTLQALSQGYETTTTARRMGTSYYPTEVHLLANNKLTQQQRDAEQKIIDMGGFKNIGGLFSAHFNLIPQVLGNVYLVTLRSNYSLEYVRGIRRIDSPCLQYIVHFFNWLLARCGYLYATTGALLLIIRQCKVSTLMALYFFLGAPLFVFFGDGYFEFEKHLQPYLMLLPLILLWPIHLQVLR
jgi:hypothetical protein